LYRAADATGAQALRRCWTVAVRRRKECQPAVGKGSVGGSLLIMPAVMTAIRTYQVGDQQFSAIVAGQGALVLCLHGFPDNNQSFRHQIPALVAAGYQVVCPLLPGYEESSQNRAGHYDMETVADTLAALIRAIQHQHGAQQPVHLIGHDWGALAGYALCVRQPELLRSFAALTIPYNLTLGAVLTRAPVQLTYSWYIQF